ncbi:hypothetical protein [Streptomyces collinus]
MIKRLGIAALAGLALSLAAGCGTADGLNNGDPVTPTATVTVTATPHAVHHKHRS